MAVSLTKGQRISLEKTAGKPLHEVVMGLGWDSKSTTSKGFLGFGKKTVNTPIDLDASCMLYDGHRLLDMVSFRQLKSKDGSIMHTGDNRSGAGDGDDEQIRVKLNDVPAQVSALVFVVNCYSNLAFSQVENAYCRLVDELTNTEVAKFNLSCNGPHTALLLAKVYRADGEWQMQAVGETATGRTADQLDPAIQKIL